MSSNSGSAPRKMSHRSSPFLPGGIPLHGDYARFEGVLYSGRPESGGGTLSPGERVTLIGTGEQPGPDWELTSAFRGNPPSEWIRVIEQSQADELFRSRGTAIRRGVEFNSLAYFPADNHVGGFIYNVSREMESRLEGIHRLEQVDQTSWYGYVPLDEIENLEIRRQPWAEHAPGPMPERMGQQPTKRKRTVLARLFGVHRDSNS